MLNKFAERLKELRLEKNLTQYGLAKKSGISQPTINGWELGKRLPSIESLIILSRFFKCTVGYLVGEED